MMWIVDIYKNTNEKISNGVKVVIGLLMIIIAAVIDVASGYADSFNNIVAIIMTAGMLSLVNALFSKLYKCTISYILFMTGNMAGLLMYLFVISWYEVIGGVFTILFAGLVFVVCWLMEMCLITGAGFKKRVLGGLLLNIATLFATTFSIIVVVTVTVLVSMLT